MKKFLLSTLFGLAVGIVPVHAEIVVKVRPPVSVHERRTLRPSREHIWIGGYHRWNETGYHWVPGHWERRPHPRAVWVPSRWQRRHDGWVFIEGHWR